MSTTLLPFLYQTQTLQRLSRTGVPTRTFRALLHSTAARSNPPRSRPHGPRHEDIPFELPEGYERPDGRSEDQDAEAGGMRSTITRQEHEIFSRIFEEIATRNATRPRPAVPPAPPPSAGPESPRPAPDESAGDSLPSRLGFLKFDDLQVRTEEPNPEKVRNTVNIIVQDAAEVQSNFRRQMMRPFDPLHPLEQTSAASDWEKALLRFPPSLRKAARMALGTIEEDKAAEVHGSATPAAEQSLSIEEKPARQLDLKLDPLAKSVQNEALRREQRNRVEAKMHAAQTDFELWDILEEEVFPLVEKLGIDEASSKAKRSRKRDKSKLPLHVYGPLYPSYLLSALRLFDTKFARSSPLALHILPRVKELGPASYVLGVSTPFYNELARILWNRYGDPTAVFNLLEEMRVAGLYCDETTRGVVQAIENFLASVGQGKWGPFLRELASLPEFEFALLPRIRHWLKTINMHIYERKHQLQA